MVAERSMKVVLALIAAGLWALALTQFEIPPAAASGVRTGVVSTPTGASAMTGQQELERPEHPEPEPGAVRAPTVTNPPLRWRVAEVREETDNFNTFCGTAITITNTTDGTVNVTIEYLDNGGVPEAVDSFTIAAFSSNFAVTDIDVEPGLLFANIPGSSGLDDFQGYAHVHADDPRIMVTARVFCRDGLGTSANIVSDYQVATYPVGSSAQFFLAGTAGQAMQEAATVPTTSER